MMRRLALSLTTLALVACGNGDDRSERANPETGTSATGTLASGTSASGTSDGPIALGMTEGQLRDADLIGANGEELGEVEGLVTGPDGSVTQLLVEIGDSSPDRYVHVPIDGLEAFDNGDDRDLRTTMTRDQLMALPQVAR